MFSPRALIGLLALVVLCLLTGLGAFLIAGSLSETTETKSPGVAPFQVPAVGVVSAVPRDRIMVEASSFLGATDGISYDPENTLDGDSSTAWNSAQAERNGLGQTLTYRFAFPVNLQALRFGNGYARDAEVYQANHRIRDITVTTDGSSQRVSLLDTSEDQEIAFEFGTTSKVTIEVTNVFVGSGFDDPSITADLALSEISFLAIQANG